MCGCARVRHLCVRVCVRACVRACVRGVCMFVYVRAHIITSGVSLLKQNYGNYCQAITYNILVYILITSDESIQ